MRENIILTEKDLFDYVFFKSQLKDDKLSLLEDGRYEFNMSLFNSIKESLGENLSVIIKNKIKLSVKCYHPIEKIILNLIKGIKSAGKSGKKSRIGLKGNIISESTFIDNDNTFLIRMINYENFSKIFLFSVYEERINNFILILNPGNESFKMQNNSLPLEIDHSINATNIELRFF